MDDDNGDVVQDRFHDGAACTLPWRSRNHKMNTIMNWGLPLGATVTRELQTLGLYPEPLSEKSGVGAWL
jgi:hypothetical protein